MKRTLTGLSLLLITALAAVAQGEKKETTPTAEQLLDKYVAAIGGKDAHAKLTTRVAKGSFEMPAMGATGDAVIYMKAPNKRLDVFNLPAPYGALITGTDGTKAWMHLASNKVLQEKAGAELAAALRAADFYLETKRKELFPKMTVAGSEKVGERETYVVEAAAAGEAPRRLYFDKQSGLLLREDVESPTSQGPQKVATYFDDYREVDGIKVPFSIRAVTPAMTLTLKLTEVKHNVPVEDAKFAKPAAP